MFRMSSFEPMATKRRFLRAHALARGGASSTVSTGPLTNPTSGWVASTLPTRPDGRGAPKR